MAYYVWHFFFFTAILYTSITAQQFEYRYHECTNSSTTNSSFPSNLNITLSSLYANAAHKDGFYNTSAGQNSDRVYGLFLCRGDTSPELCQSCIKTSSEDIMKQCPDNKEAIIWYDRCMLRYSNRSIFSIAEQRPTILLWNANDIENVMNLNQFNASLGDLMNQLVTSAVSSSDLFAMGDRNGTAFSKLYGLVQCTPDISPSECGICLSSCVSDIPGCCNGKQGGNILKPSCSIRYEIYPFYTASPAPPPPASSPSLPTPPTTSSNPSGKRNTSSRAIVYITVPTSAFVVLLFTLFYCYLHHKARKKYNAPEGGNVGDEITSVQSLQFDLGTIEAATNNFSDINKIGKGGFGDVYMGRLPNGEEKLLIYEYVPNKSLDYFLFDPAKQRLLDWWNRY
ncbi:cysteine-rich receptor-like protein kinase 10 [Populus alba x Populus x berolinensis]|uniref:Cysteine-rich receptor-like protein kinase 10 n=1 Tax=Populus alba x Populus x berolinensis TaxID=444605 RepID=A0AAD6M4D8_9ROSI|nr:cysteine-rich receptor-like protein kinase 10 [Populus alba x Populus x berolinensis]